MTHNPYRLDGPALVSLSGGRTSGYMLRQILDAHDGKLPADIHVVFFNTGKEFEQTLRFVHECSVRWSVPITWLEYDPAEPFDTSVVGYNSASRDGEPFEKIIKVRGFLPNPTMRLCTHYLKVKRGIAFMRDMLGYPEWTNVVGLRHDEPRRVARQKAMNEAGKERFETILPLDVAKVTRRDVSAFWKRQPFDLGLPDNNGKTPLGNCDLCYMKGAATIKGIMRLFPERAKWWIDQERNAPAMGSLTKPEMALFRADRPSYRELLNFVRRQRDFEGGPSDDCLPCDCTD
ncbi:phosphoadenosine phosphosulfate reductase family protein [Magnetospirillum sp. SS-4]|uniref:phosphoadenosine phosphosulfate reductase domain-containing protein n=1 Tax=Magnetospirillum sp. SS-4 TaxID=2681465 RepID=UPI00137D5D69|nr:phosphoadenosine phosphosulfate reductase family protein [Magnetospirillum sp. SS-4]CAA7614813.1 3'-phosphoadenosine 5'-phosphosulfate sulfotransferase/FAD synthetase and related enzyme [Magnetospirillum sp. SS-4]